MTNENLDKKIFTTLHEKSTLKQQIFDNTVAVFADLKLILNDLTEKLNKQLTDADRRVLLEYKDNGVFSAQLKLAGDMLIFGMHSNVFQFDRNHGVWKTSYVKEDPLAGYCGIIHIYNFLADSFKYNRMEDLGYLIGRIFINKDKKYFVEGKRQLGFYYSNFGSEEISRHSLGEIISLAINYALDFDLLVPPYDTVKITSVEQVSQRIEFSKIKTGKRLGFRFNSDDITESGYKP